MPRVMVTHLHVVDWCVSLRRACTLLGKAPHLTGCIIFKKNKGDMLHAHFVRTTVTRNSYLSFVCTNVMHTVIHRKGTACSTKKIYFYIENFYIVIQHVSNCCSQTFEKTFSKKN